MSRWCPPALARTLCLGLVLGLAPALATAQTGTISGTVLETGTGTPLPGIDVIVYAPNQSQAGIGTTLPDGTYSVAGLTPGDYYVVTADTGTHVNEIHPNVACPGNIGCDSFMAIVSGTAVTVSSGGTSTVSFTLDPGGSVSGTVNGSGAALPATPVNVYTSLGVSAGTALTDISGHFTLDQLPSGSYYLATADMSGDWVDEAFDNVQCSGPCTGFSAVALGQSIAVTAPAAVTGRDFDLAPAGRIAGVVTDAIPNPIPGLEVSLFSDLGEPLTYTTTGLDGSYELDGLKAGTYRVATTAQSQLSPYLNEVWDDLPCTGQCLTAAIAAGAPIAVTAGVTTGGKNFALGEGRTISGTLITQGGPALAFTSVRAVSADGSSVDGSSDLAGAYTLQQMRPGTYYVHTASSNPSWINEVHDDHPCTGACTSAFAIASGDSVDVTAGNVSGIDFDLGQAGSISGTVTDAASMLAQASIQVSAYTPAGVEVASTVTNASGQYTLGGLMPGDYRIAARPAPPHVQEVWNDHICGVSCTVAMIQAGDAITVVGGAVAANKDFALSQYGKITGTVTLEGSGTPLSGVFVTAYDSAGASVTSSSTNASGAYTIGGLQPGTYYLAVVAGGVAISEIYDNHQCPFVCLPDEITSLGAPIIVSFGVIASGKDFALEPLASISGTVTDADTGAPVVGVAVAVFTSAGMATPFPAITNASGAFTIPGLKSGTYYAGTGDLFSASGYLHEAYDNIPCGSSSCGQQFVITNGTPIALAAPAPAAGINFALSHGVTITGTITGAGGAPLQGIFVRALHVNGDDAGFVATNSSGVYTIGGLTAGTYFLSTGNNQNYFNEVYNDIPCNGFCDDSEVLAGTPVVATAGSVTADFALVQGGGISGKVTSALTGEGIENAAVAIVTAAGANASFGLTDSSGSYQTFLPLQPGTYYVYVTAPGHLGEYYDNVSCNGPCEGNQAPMRGTPVVVTAGGVAADRDFVLEVAARITGTLTTSAGAPIANEFVAAYDAAGVRTSEADTDDAGHYVLDGLAPGTYRVATEVAGNFLNEVWDDIKCTGRCGEAEVRAGTPIVISGTETVSGKNFALDPGAKITGTVTDATSGAPIGDLFVTAISADGTEFEGDVDDAGVYEINGLAAGVYVLLTEQAEDTSHLNEIYDNVPCPQVRCFRSLALQAGTKLTIGTGATTTADFALATGGSFSGTLTDASTGAPIAGAVVNAVRSFDGEIESVASTTTTSSGAYTVSGLPAGTWYAVTDNQAGYFDLIHPGIPCTTDCSWGHALAGTPIASTPGSLVTGIDFALTVGGRVSGRVTSAVNGAPISFARVVIVDQVGGYISQGFTNASGDFITGTGIATGTYYAFASAEEAFVSEIYDDIPCQTDCYERASSGAAIAVTTGATTAGKDFALSRGGSISGRITDGSGTPLSGVSVFTFDAAGRFVDSSSTSSDGNYETHTGLLAGTYYAFTSNEDHLVNEIFDNLPCQGECVDSQAGSGVPIGVSSGVPTPGIDFALSTASGVPGPPLDLEAEPDAGRVRLSWDAPEAGATATGYVLEAGFAPGTTALTVPVSGTQYLVDSVSPGRYFVRVRAINGAGAGAASDEIEVVIGAGNQIAPGRPIEANTMMVGRKLYLSWDGPFTGGPVGDFIVEAGSASGLANIATVSATRPIFTYEPVPDGVYFLRVRARNAAGVSPPSDEVMLVVGAPPAPPRAPGQLAATASGSTVNVSWFAPPGPVAGYVLEAGSASGLSNLATVTLGPVTSVSFPGIPPGRYFVRMRAVNAQGRSVISDEIEVIVR